MADELYFFAQPAAVRPVAVLLADLRAMLQQQPYGPRIRVVRRHRQHQRRHLTNVHGIHIGARIQQRLGDLRTARRRCQHERREIPQLDRPVLYRLRLFRADRVHIGAFRQQELDRLQISVARRQHQRSPSEVVPSIDRSALLSQQLDGGQIVRRRGRYQRRSFDFRPVLQQVPDRGRGAIVGRRQVQCGAPHLRPGIDIRLGSHQQADLFGFGDGPHQRRRAELVLCVDVRSCGENRPQRFHAAVGGRVVQRCGRVLVLEFHPLAVHHRVNHRQIVLPDRTHSTGPPGRAPARNRKPSGHPVPQTP